MSALAGKEVETSAMLAEMRTEIQRLLTRLDTVAALLPTDAHASAMNWNMMRAYDRIAAIGHIQGSHTQWADKHGLDHWYVAQSARVWKDMASDVRALWQQLPELDAVSLDTWEKITGSPKPTQRAELSRLISVRQTMPKKAPR